MKQTLVKRMQAALPVLALTLGVSALGTANAALLWAGADLRTSGLDVHAGSALLPIPLVGTAGIEAGAATRYGSGLSEVRLGATLRDLNLPFTRTDAFIGGGAAYHLSTATSNAGLGLYLEGGLRGPLLGPAGWRASVRGDTKSGLSAGAGLEVRF